MGCTRSAGMRMAIVTMLLARALHSQAAPPAPAGPAAAGPNAPSAAGPNAPSAAGPNAPAAAAPDALDAAVDAIRRALDAAVAAGDGARVQLAHAESERLLARHPGHPLLEHYVGYALYRAATLAPPGAGGGRREADALLRAADRALARAASRPGAPAETQALRAIVVARQIGANPLKGMVLGPRSARMLDDAAERAPANPRVWLLRGTHALYTPAAFGGGPASAERHFLRAIELFAADAPPPRYPAWGRAEARAWLGLTYARTGRLAGARAAYTAALAEEPEFAWVARRLLPALDSLERAAVGGAP